MLKKRIEWVDFNGVKRSKDFNFNFMESEIQEMNLRYPGGLEGRLKRISEEQDPDELVDYFKSLILDSYGVKSDDGIRFIKSKQLSEEFSQTGAYNKLFMELSTNTSAAIEFVRGIIPDIPEPTKAPERSPEKIVTETPVTYDSHTSEIAPVPYNVLAKPTFSPEQ